MRGNGREGTPKGLVYVRNPEKYPDCRTDLIGGAATQTFAPGGKYPRAATGELSQVHGVGRSPSRNRIRTRCIMVLKYDIWWIQF